MNIRLSWAVLAVIAGAGCGPAIVWHGHSLDRTVRLRVLEDSGQQWLRRDSRGGKRSGGARSDGARYDGIAVGSLAMSRSANTIAFAARRGARWTVVRNGRPGALWDGIGEVVLDSAGKHLAYSAQSGPAWRVVRDGAKPGPVFDALLAGTLRFSRDGTRLVHVGARGGCRHVVVDGKVGPCADGIGQLTLPRHGTRFAYAMRRGDGWRVVLDGTAGPVYRRVRGLRFAADGARFGYFARSAGGWRVVLDGKVSEPSADLRDLRFRPGDNAAAFVRSRAGEAVVVVGAQIGQRYDAIVADSLRFSPRGAHMLYIGVRKGRAQVVVDGRQGPPLERVAPPVFSATNEHWGYAGWLERGSLVVIDGRQIKVAGRASDLVLGAHGKRFAFVARDGGRAVVHVDGRPFPFDAVVPGSLTFSADARSWGCVVGDLADEQLYITINGVGSRAFDTDELAGHVTRTGRVLYSRAEQADLLRTWVRAELAIASGSGARQ